MADRPGKRRGPGSSRAGRTGETPGDGRRVDDLRPVGFPGEMPREQRRSYRAVLAYFLAVVAALMWPVYELAAGIEPRLLGVPFSLAYLVILLVGSFVVLLGLYLWEGRRYGHEPPDELDGGTGGEDCGSGGCGG